jgi:hypothetical protein
MGTQNVEAPVRIAADRSQGLALILLGGLLGLAWAAGMRGFMAQIVGAESSVSWSGTFGYILLPGLLIGLLLGWAQHLRHKGDHRRAWLALSPVLFAAVLLKDGPQGVLGIFDDGLGGGAIGIPLYAMAGGYAIAGRGPCWGRLVCGALALTAIPVWAMTVESFAGADLAVTTPRGLWVALYYYSFLALIMIAAAIPHRPTIDA